jgi:hypothetical protein
MLQVLFLSAASTAGALPTPAQERIGIYVLAAIVGVLVSGLITCAKEIRRQRADRAARA